MPTDAHVLHCVDGHIDGCSLYCHGLTHATLAAISPGWNEGGRKAKAYQVLGEALIRDEWFLAHVEAAPVSHLGMAELFPADYQTLSKVAHKHGFDINDYALVVAYVLARDVVRGQLPI